MIKICTKCSKPKDLKKDFSFKNKNKNIKLGYCKSCMKDYHKTHYNDNINDYKIKNHLHKNKTIQENIDKIIEYKFQHPCIDCGNTNPIVLQFDHIDRKTKSNNVSYILRSGVSWTKIYQEIAKCEVRCANCHSIKTANQLQWFTKSKYKDQLFPLVSPQSSKL